MNKKPLFVAIVAAGLALGLTHAAGQQRGPGWGMMGPGMMDRDSPMGRGSMMGMMGGCPMMSSDGQGSAFIDGRIAFLKAELAITEAQMGAWDAYADATKRDLESMQGVVQTLKTVSEAKTPVERLDGHLAAMESRSKALKNVRPALAKLYEVLSAEQKKKADEILTGVGCMM